MNKGYLLNEFVKAYRLLTTYNKLCHSNSIFYYAKHKQALILHVVQMANMYNEECYKKSKTSYISLSTIDFNSTKSFVIFSGIVK